MDEKIFRVIRGYSKLGYDERKQVREFISKYEDTEFAKRGSLIESIQKSLGPTSQDICPCCGK